MTGTRKGGLKAAAKNLERDPDFYKKIGSKGGKNGHTCGIIVSKGDTMKINGYEEYQILSNGVVLGKNGRPMKPQMDEKGYLRVQLRNPAKQNDVATFKIHRLVAEHFLKNPKHLPQVDHIDGDKSNNDVSNLEWVTNEENQRRAVERGAYAKRLPENVKKYGDKILYAISKGYISKDLFDKYQIERKTFWRAVERGDITIGDTFPNTDGVRKKAYYYYDLSRGKWRVERSDFIPTGKQFNTEDEAKKYAEHCIVAGGFAANPGLARLAGAKGGKRSRRGPAKRDAQGRAVNKDGTLHGANGSHMRVRANDISEKSNILDATPLTFEEQKIQRGNLFRKFFGRNK